MRDRRLYSACWRPRDLDELPPFWSTPMSSILIAIVAIVVFGAFMVFVCEWAAQRTKSAGEIQRLNRLRPMDDRDQV